MSEWWYLSFVDPDRPQGDRWVGAVCVRADGFMSAVMESHRLGVNPFGEVQGTPLAYVLPPGRVPAPSFRNRLLTRDEAGAIEHVEDVERKNVPSLIDRVIDWFQRRRRWPVRSYGAHGAGVLEQCFGWAVVALLAWACWELAAHGLGERRGAPPAPAGEERASGVVEE